MAAILDLNNLTPAETEIKNALTEAGLPTSEAALQAEFVTLAASSGIAITNTSDYSPFWRAVKAMSIKPAVWCVAFLIRKIVPNLYVKTASGWWLDSLAYSYGVERKAAATAKGKLTFTRTDTSGALVIPAGTRVRSAAINGVVRKLKTDAEAVMGIGVSTLQVNASAEGAGTAWNLGTGYFSLFEDIVPGITTVTNASDWLSTPGADAETDEELRLRVRNQFAAVGAWHTDAKYKSIITERSGIRVDRIYFDHAIPRGPGSADAYIVFDAGTTPTAILADLNTAITTDGNHGHGDDLLVKAMPTTTHTLTVTAYIDSSVQGAALTQLLTDIGNFIRCAFRENTGYDGKVTKVLPYSRFSFSLLAKELHAEFPKITSLVWGQSDIVSTLAVPRINTLTVTGA